MAASGPSDIGITQTDALLIESVEWEKKLSEATIKTTTGGFGDGKAFDPIIDFTVRGRGDTTVAAGDAVAGIDAISSGTTIVNKVKHSTKNDDFDSFEYSGQNFPGA